MAIALTSLRPDATGAVPVGPFLAFRRPLDVASAPSAAGGAAAASTIVQVERRAPLVSGDRLNGRRLQDASDQTLQGADGAAMFFTEPPAAFAVGNNFVRHLRLLSRLSKRSNAQ